MTDYQKRFGTYLLKQTGPVTTLDIYDAIKLSGGPFWQDSIAKVHITAHNFEKKGWVIARVKSGGAERGYKDEKSIELTKKGREVFGNETKN